MKKNTKGLSTIVATLLIILLTLVAVGIIWIVVRNVVQGGSEQISIDAKCLAANVVATKVVNSSETNYSVTLSRQGGDDALGGVALVFTNAEGSNSFRYDVLGSQYPLAALSIITVPVTIETGVLANPTRVSVVVFFLDDSGNEQLCQTATQLAF